MNVDFHFRHSLSPGGPGASSALFAPVGSPLDALFPQESRTFRSNQLEFFFKKTVGWTHLEFLIRLVNNLWMKPSQDSGDSLPNSFSRQTENLEKCLFSMIIIMQVKIGMLTGISEVNDYSDSHPD